MVWNPTPIFVYVQKQCTLPKGCVYGEKPVMSKFGSCWEHISEAVIETHWLLDQMLFLPPFIQNLQSFVIIDVKIQKKWTFIQDALPSKQLKIQLPTKPPSWKFVRETPSAGALLPTRSPTAMVLKPHWLGSNGSDRSVQIYIYIYICTRVCWSLVGNTEYDDCSKFKKMERLINDTDHWLRIAWHGDCHATRGHDDQIQAIHQCGIAQAQRWTTQGRHLTVWSRNRSTQKDLEVWWRLIWYQDQKYIDRASMKTKRPFRNWAQGTFSVSSV